MEKIKFWVIAAEAQGLSLIKQYNPILIGKYQNTQIWHFKYEHYSIDLYLSFDIQTYTQYQTKTGIIIIPGDNINEIYGLLCKLRQYHVPKLIYHSTDDHYVILKRLLYSLNYKDLKQ